MDKKYQVFVSSTYVDLLEERKEVIQVLLELDCIPIGMELFPASDDDQWSFIQSVIDDCDYYVLILAGRYGSCSEDGLGYTEMEYRYALKTGKPIISFIHSDPGSISASMTDSDPELANKLVAFRELAQKKLCKFWKSPTELGGAVGRSIVQLKKRAPAIGWVKANNVPGEGATQEILNLKNQIDQLKFELAQSSASTGIDVSELSQGEDNFEIEVIAKGGDGFFTNLKQLYKASFTWNKVFSALAPLLIDDESEPELKNRLNEFLLKENAADIWEFDEFSVCEEISCHVDKSSFETIIIQLRALDLIQKSRRNRSVKDNQTYWCLTEHGDDVMMGLRAIRK